MGTEREEKTTVRLRKPLILVVDDDDDFRETIVGVLRDHGYAVQAASDGVAALSALRKDGIVPAVVLLDLWMPRMDGWQLRRELLQPPHTDVPVVVMTAVGPENAQLLGVQHVLEKPFGIEQLLSVIDDCC